MIMDESMLPNIFMTDDSEMTISESPAKLVFTLPQPRSTSGSTLYNSLRTPSPYHTPQDVRIARRRKKLLAQFAEDEREKVERNEQTTPESTNKSSMDIAQCTVQCDVTPTRSHSNRKSRNLLFSGSTSESVKTELVCSFDEVSSSEDIELPNPEDFYTSSQAEAKVALDRLDWKKSENTDEIARLSKRVYHRTELKSVSDSPSPAVKRVKPESVTIKPEAVSNGFESDGFSDDSLFEDAVGDISSIPTTINNRTFFGIGTDGTSVQTSTQKTEVKTIVAEVTTTIEEDEWGDDSFFEEAVESQVLKTQVPSSTHTNSDEWDEIDDNLLI